jgi:hypothetical protein
MPILPSALLPAGSWVPVGGLLATRLKSNIWASGHILIGMRSWTKPSLFPSTQLLRVGKDAKPLSCLPALKMCDSCQRSNRGRPQKRQRSPRLEGHSSNFYFWLEMYPWTRHSNFFLAGPTSSPLSIWSNQTLSTLLFLETRMFPRGELQSNSEGTQRSEFWGVLFSFICHRVLPSTFSASDK